MHVRGRENEVRSYPIPLSERSSDHLDFCPSITTAKMNAGLRVSPDRSRSTRRKGTGTFSGYGSILEEDHSPEDQIDSEFADERNCVVAVASSSSSLLTFAQRPDPWQYMLAQLHLPDLGKMPQLCRTIAGGSPFDNPWLPFWRWMVVERAPGAVLLREFWNHETHLVRVWKGLLDKMDEELLGSAQKPWRDLLQSVLKLGFHGYDDDRGGRSDIKQTRTAATLKEVELGLATLAARLMLGKDHLMQNKGRVKRHHNENGRANQSLREYFNAQVSNDNDVADMISWLYSISHGLSFSDLQGDDNGCQSQPKDWQELVQRVVRGVVVPGLIAVLQEQPHLVDMQPDSRTQADNEGSPSFAIAITSPLSLMEAVLGRVLAIGIAFSAVLAHDDVARVAACRSESPSALIRTFFCTFLESFGTVYCSANSSTSISARVPGSDEMETTYGPDNTHSNNTEETSNGLSARVQPTTGLQAGSSSTKNSHHRSQPANMPAVSVPAEGKSITGDVNDVWRAAPAEVAQLMSGLVEGEQRSNLPSGGQPNSLHRRDGLTSPEDTSPESSSREGGGEETSGIDSDLPGDKENTGGGVHGEDVASISASSFIASLFQRMELGKVETICFSTSWKCAGFEAGFRQAADSLLYEIFGMKLSMENDSEESKSPPRLTKCDRAPNDVEIRVWSPRAHKLKGAILPAGCVHSSAMLLRTAEAVAEANNVSECPWPRDAKRSAQRTAVIRNTIGEELKANYRSWTKAQEWVVLADVKAQQQLHQQNLWQLQQTRNRLLLIMREHEQLLLEYRPLIQSQQLPPDRRERLRRICQDAMERLALEHEYHVHLQQEEEQLILRQREQEEITQHQALEERLQDRFMQLQQLNQDGHRRKLNSLRRVTSALPFIRIQVVFPPLGRGMTIISLVRSIMEKISQLDEDGQDDDMHLFGDDDEDNVFGDPLQRATILSFFGVS